MSEIRIGRYLPTRLDLHPTAWIAPGAVLVGEVSLGESSSVWYGCVLRGDMEPVHIGSRTNLQDGTIIHVDTDAPAVVGDGVTVGHRALLHGCRVEDDCLIGMGAVVLTGAVIGAGSLVAAGSLVREGQVVPPGTFVAGLPARVRGPLPDDFAERIREGAGHYVSYAAGYRRGEMGRGPFSGRREPDSNV